MCTNPRFVLARRLAPQAAADGSRHVQDLAGIGPPPQPQARFTGSFAFGRGEWPEAGTPANGLSREPKSVTESPPPPLSPPPPASLFPPAVPFARARFLCDRVRLAKTHPPALDTCCASAFHPKPSPPPYPPEHARTPDAALPRPSVCHLCARRCSCCCLPGSSDRAGRPSPARPIFRQSGQERTSTGLHKHERPKVWPAPAAGNQGPAPEAVDSSSQHRQCGRRHGCDGWNDSPR